MSLFTKDPYMKILAGRLLLIDIVLEVGRVTNLVFGRALKTSGDAVFTIIIAVIFMYLCAVGGTYCFGMRLNWLVSGAYAGMALLVIGRYGLPVHFYFNLSILPLIQKNINNIV